MAAIVHVIVDPLLAQMVLVPLQLVSRIGRKHVLIKHRDSSCLRSINNDFVFKVLLP